MFKETNTNFDSLIKNIENDIELYEFIEKLVLEDEEIAYIKTDEIINKGSIYFNGKEKK
ncbi:hypothetical protein [Clostridium beijerinckii]|uniref:hypothetical protein n=1 Tax=Clostridium beijerinckii TaxID=1520 RepID=UPI001361A33F|nr:hypothetical protein [Clostridium beijerinckii]MZK49863.1 hypothetical protein [Clostridium beijerinckii]MZK57822.1 hypothetical protein [Clostridium beijerinckii]MZK68033.1 hypothetical protein [Clostridium beijerinckii]MZK73530.1 hypothetical protein [Clostridium beijerinckii]MZK83113.1 hypothetical protein [Clostridium beijerinckii]